jgi:hypothetical protein
VQESLQLWLKLDTQPCSLWFFSRSAAATQMLQSHKDRTRQSQKELLAATQSLELTHRHPPTVCIPEPESPAPPRPIPIPPPQPEWEEAFANLDGSVAHPCCDLPAPGRGCPQLPWESAPHPPAPSTGRGGNRTLSDCSAYCQVRRPIRAKGGSNAARFAPDSSDCIDCEADPP